MSPARGPVQFQSRQRGPGRKKAEDKEARWEFGVKGGGEFRPNALACSRIHPPRRKTHNGLSLGVDTRPHLCSQPRPSGREAQQHVSANRVTPLGGLFLEEFTSRKTLD